MINLVARIAMDGGEVPTLSALSSFIKMMWPGSPALVERNTQGAGFVCELGDVELAVMPAPMPIPWEEIEGACKRSWMWPEAVEVMQSAPAHMVVSAKSRAGGYVETALALSKMTNAVTDVIQARGVHFGAAGVVSSADQFFQMSRKMSEQALPLYLWLGFHAFKEEDDKTTIYTSGMGAFGGVEVEAVSFSQPLEEVLDLTYTIVHHMLAGGMELADGDTLDLGDGLVLKASHTGSRFLSERQVIRIEPG